MDTTRMTSLSHGQRRRQIYLFIYWMETLPMNTLSIATPMTTPLAATPHPTPAVIDAIGDYYDLTDEAVPGTQYEDSCFHDQGYVDEVP